MLGRLLCRIGLHKGNIYPAHEIGEDIDGSSAFVCHRAGCLHVDPIGPSHTKELCRKLRIPKLKPGEES